AGHLYRRLLCGRRIRMHGVHEADRAGALGVEVVAGETELGCDAAADDAGQPLERADVGDDRDARLAYGEARVRGRDADVARGDEIDAAADAPAVDGGDDRLRTVGDGRDRPLEPRDLAQRAHALSRAARLAAAGHRAAHRLQVEPDREVRATRGQHDDARL